MPYFELPEDRVALSAKIPESLKAKLMGIVRLWRFQAEAQGMDGEKAKRTIDLTYVVERLLTVGVEGVWAESSLPAGIRGMPRTDAEWAALEKALTGHTAAELAAKASKPSKK